jgi:hypothetical protein
LAFAYVVYKKSDEAAAAIYGPNETVNPVSDQNFVNKAFNSTMAAVTGNEYEGFSFGVWLYDVTHPDESFDLNAGTL